MQYHIFCSFWRGGLFGKYTKEPISDSNVSLESSSELNCLAESYDESISGNHAHLNIIARDSRFKICYQVSKVWIGWKGAYIFDKNMGKGLNKVLRMI